MEVKGAWLAKCRFSHLAVIDAAHAMHGLYNVGCPSVPSIDSSSDARRVCWRARARAADIDRQLQAPELRLRVALC